MFVTRLLFALPALVASCASVGLLVYTRRRLHDEVGLTSGLRDLYGFWISILLWSLGVAFETLSPDLESKIRWTQFQYLGIAPVGVFWLLFCLRYAAGRTLPLWVRGGLLFVVPLATVVLAWTYPHHGLIWQEISLVTDGLIPYMTSQRGWWFWWVLTPYGYATLLLGVAVVIWALLTSSRHYRRQLIVVLVAAGLVFPANLLYIAGFKPFQYSDPTPVGFAVASAVLAWGIFRSHLLDMIPVAQRVAFNSLPDGVLMLDERERVLDANPVAGSLLSRAPGLTIGEAAESVIPVWPQIRDLPDGETSAPIKVPAPPISESSAEAGARYFRFRFSPLHGYQRQVIGRILVAHDVSESQVYRELAAQEEARVRFLTHVSHELRTPLTLIAGALQRLASSEKLDPESERELERALGGAGTMKRLVDEVLDAGRGDTAGLCVAEIDLGRIAKAQLEALAPLAEEREIELSGEGLESSNYLFLDEARVEKILANLLSNAIKFTPAGGKVTLRVLPVEQGHEVLLEVADTGCGIDAEDLHRVWDRYYQGEHGRSQSTPGTGLGLAVVKESVELHGGRVSVDSVVGEGSTFRAFLLRGRDHFGPEVRFVDGLTRAIPRPDGNFVTEKLSPALAVEAAAGAVAHQDGRPVVLVVDDNKELRELLEEILSPRYEVVLAGDGEMALSLARELQPDLVLADVMMPRMDGIELTEELAHDPELSATPVLLLTAKAATDDKVRGLRSGAEDYITKPFDVDELSARVDSVLERRRRLQTWLETALAGKGRSTRRRPFPDRVLQIIKQRASDEGLSITRLAEELAMSRSQLYREVQKHFGVSPQLLLRDTRLELARGLLDRGADTVSEVAFAVGFSSHSHFTSAFRKRFGTTPSQYSRGIRG